MQTDPRGGKAKHYSRVSEQQWFDKHGHIIYRLARERFQGDATGLPLQVPADEDGRRDGRMPATGNANVDATVSVIQGGMSMWNALQRGGGRDVGGWGGDT